ncbi:hypothetical protein LWC34_38025 [Kibdelosporangium philippinense]|uniref:DUF2059 domain-containing protein n=1 Tax=Kibdelosporangium philippinense TaxID=211113 RepID=A0ABS8ZL89_9PSEU|nr:hypothetical protein [Kibdelosporangium philippinense]MCE7008571.1 hypothetical protein [Kibdelosporangium philippinense]
MPPRTFLKPVATVVIAAVLATGAAPTAMADQQDNVLVTTLRQAVTPEQIDALATKAAAAGDTATVARLAGAKAALSTQDIQDIDWIEAFKLAFKVLQPFAVAALRYGGPIASGIIEYVGEALKQFPQLGEPLNELFFKPIAGLIRVWAPRLADLIESIKIDNVPHDQAVARVADHLQKEKGLSAEAATVLSKGLIANV